MRTHVRRRGGTRDIVLLGLAVVVGAAALLLAMRGEEQAPADESTWVYFKCAKCSAVFHLNGREIDEALRGAGAGRDGRSLAFRCKQCGELAAERTGNPALAPG